MIQYLAEANDNLGGLSTFAWGVICVGIAAVGMIFSGRGGKK